MLACYCQSAFKEVSIHHIAGLPPGEYSSSADCGSQRPQLNLNYHKHKHHLKDKSQAPNHTGGLSQFRTSDISQLENETKKVTMSSTWKMNDINRGNLKGKEVSQSLEASWRRWEPTPITPYAFTERAKQSLENVRSVAWTAAVQQQRASETKAEIKVRSQAEVLAAPLPRIDKCL